MISTIFVLLLNANVPNPVQTALLIQQAAESAQIDPILLAKVIVVESRGRPNVINKVTGDYGIAQINLKSHPKVSAECALDIYCGLWQGAQILKKTRRPCAFNLGAVGAIKHPKACAAYEARLASIGN